MKKKRVICIFHDNNLYSGATKSFLSNVIYMYEEKEFEILCLIPKKEGDLYEYLKSKKLQCIRATYGGLVYSIKDNMIQQIAEMAKCLMKFVFMYLNLNISLIWKIKKFNPDVLYSNTSTIYLGALINKKISKKHIWHFREYGEADQRSKRLFGYLYLEKCINKYTNSIVFISENLEKYYQDKVTIETSNVHMLYNDLDKSYINKQKKAHDGINILITGTICVEKGQFDAIKAIEKINKKIDLNITLYIAGKINVYGKKLEEYCKNKKLTNIVFCGLVKEMNELREKMDVSIVASKSEAFGRIIIENMVSNLFTIATNAGGIPELVEHKRTGLLFQYGDINELSDSLLWFIENKNSKIVKEMISNAHDFSLQFLKNKTAIKISELMRE